MGLRDYAMFLLMTHYGLRPSEIVDLTLDDIAWRKGEIRVVQRKTGQPLYLPLMDQVATALVEYLHSRPLDLPYRQLFLRVRAPAGLLKPTAVTEAFQRWARLSGLAIPFQGSYCLRHSYAVRLLQSGGVRQNHWRPAWTSCDGKYRGLPEIVFGGFKRCGAAAAQGDLR